MNDNKIFHFCSAPYNKKSKLVVVALYNLNEEHTNGAAFRKHMCMPGQLHIRQHQRSGVWKPVWGYQQSEKNSMGTEFSLCTAISWNGLNECDIFHGVFVSVVWIAHAITKQQCFWLTWKVWVYVMIHIRQVTWLSVCGKDFNVAIFSDVINMINVRLCVMVVLFELCTTFSDLDCILRSQQCQTVLTANVMFLSN